MEKNEEIKVKEVVITHADGRSEKVWVPLEDDAPSWREHLSTVYTVVGILALSLTAYLTYLNLKNAKK